MNAIATVFHRSMAEDILTIRGAPLDYDDFDDACFDDEEWPDEDDEEYEKRLLQHAKTAWEENGPSPADYFAAHS